MSTFTTFAVAGAGNVGSAVVDELLKKKNHKVTILTRDDTKQQLQDFKSRGAVLAKVDYTDRAGLTKALTGVEVVVTAFGLFAHDVQTELAHAAKVAGVQLFVPTEYGINKPADSPFGAADAALRKLFREIDLPYAAFFNGLFFEYAAELLKLKKEEGTIQIVGDGKHALSLTLIKDVGAYVANAVSTADKKDLQWAEIALEGDRKTPLEIAAIAEKKWGKKLEITHVDVEENKKLIAAFDFNAFLSQLAVEGKAVTGTPEELAAAKAKFAPKWIPTPYEAFIQ